ncbi:MAG: HTTM domain-containing protein [Fuerstiella sp.]|nr:HTTM domain-containing protein [Fuerstiella sp.]
MSTVPTNTPLRRCFDTARSAAAQWRTFWFDPVDPFTLGIIRALTGSMLVYNLLVWGLDLNAFFASDGLQPLATVTQFHQNDLVFSFLYFVTDEWLLVVHWSCVIVALMFCLGLATRLTSVLAFLITISYSQRVPIANFGLDQILGMLCLYLAIGPSGAALSIDQLIRDRWRKSKGLSSGIRKLTSARTALRLIQIHMCVIYFWAGFAKLKGDTWWTGEAMWQVIANQEYQTVDLTWMAWVPWLPYLIAHITVVWEVFFCILVWNHRWRPLMLAVGTGMHLGIGAFLGMWTFGLIMTYGYFAFGSPEWWRKRLTLSDPLAHENNNEGRVPISERNTTTHAMHTLNEWNEVANELECPIRQTHSE